MLHAIKKDLVLPIELQSLNKKVAEVYTLALREGNTLTFNADDKKFISGPLPPRNLPEMISTRPDLNKSIEETDPQKALEKKATAEVAEAETLDKMKEGYCMLTDQDSNNNTLVIILICVTIGVLIIFCFTNIEFNGKTIGGRILSKSKSFSKHSA